MGRGKLRVYLGAAPGVGKTYAMLGRGPPPARARHRRRGRVRRDPRPPAHGRAARGPGGRARAVSSPTAARRSPRWTSTPCSPAVPQVALVDELAHTNVPGSRNEKRWQDVQELLAAGIDVITTVNIQHLESLQRRRREDHRRAAAGDGARRGGPRGRPGRAGRHDARGAAPPDGPRQRLPAGEGRRRAGQLLPGRQPHRAARAGPALDRRQGRRGAAGLPRADTTSRRPGRPANGSSSR